MNTMFILRFTIFVFCIFNFIGLHGKCNNMVFIPKGEYMPLFKVGDNFLDEKIVVNSFYMSKYPITNSDFKYFIDSNPDWSKENIKNLFADKEYLNHWNDTVSFNTIASCPVVNVSWFAANEYCKYIGGRLPNIDEWEYVASASITEPDAKNDSDYLNNILNWYINSDFNDFISIEFMNSNYWGIFGLHGFIWEWVFDFNSVILLNTDAEGGGLEEVLYCGATATNAIDPADYVAFMRFAFRNSLEANYTMNSLGFRCVKNVNK